MTKSSASTIGVDNPASITEALIARGEDHDVVQNSLEFVREHLGMEVSYLSEFVGEELVFRAVSAPGLEDLVATGNSMPLDQVYCPHILSGKLPELIPDTGEFPFAKAIPITDAIPIRSHVSVPIRRSDGSVYGMFCCLSRQTNRSLNNRDLGVMRAFASLSANMINQTVDIRRREEEVRTRINEALHGGGFEIRLQPIFLTSTRRGVGAEALSRFHSEPYMPPNFWFDDAAEIGMQTELELAAIAKALKTLSSLPPHAYLSVNASPATALSGQLLDVISGYPAERIVVELTEHDSVESYDDLIRSLDDLRFKGVRLAIDDAGAGYSGLQHMVRIAPEIIKLDISLTSGIDTDVVRRSLTAAMVGFANETGASIVAEGVETEAEFSTLAELGVELVQGYLLGRPASVADVAEILSVPDGSLRRA